jgi:hypothetical protein
MEITSAALQSADSRASRFSLILTLLQTHSSRDGVPLLDQTDAPYHASMDAVFPAEHKDRSFERLER